MKQIKAHINQLVSQENQLTTGDGLYIDLKYHKELNDEVLAHKATYCEWDDDGTLTEEEWSVHDAMLEWHSYINGGCHGIDGILAVLCPDNIWRKVLWFTDDRVGQAFSLKQTTT